MPLKAESLEELGGRVIVSDGHPTSESVIISVAHLSRSQES
ncbi:MAG TPA: hypothetical protein VGM98_06160 [Schlesneria sp.]